MTVIAVRKYSGAIIFALGKSGVGGSAKRLFLPRVGYTIQKSALHRPNPATAKLAK